MVGEYGPRIHHASNLQPVSSFVCEKKNLFFSDIHEQYFTKSGFRVSAKNIEIGQNAPFV